MTDRARDIMRMLFGMVMFLLGVTLALLFNGITGSIGTLGQNVGLALIVTGSISLFQETILSRLRKDEIKEDFDKISNETQEGFSSVFGLLKGPGIHMLSPGRRGHPHYHRWLLEKSPQEMTFAGHSVLHRVQADFTNLGLISVHKALRQKVSEGSKIRILFLDPIWSFLDQIAKDEGQDPRSLRTDLATTLGICRNLWEDLENERLAGDIDIRTCTELKQYAFHYVSCRERNEEEMLVGFYFAGRLGTKSPLFVVENEEVQEFFVEHFNTVFERAKKLLTYSRDGMINFGSVQ